MTARNGRYLETSAAWKADPVGFCAEATKAIDWIKLATQVFNPNPGGYGRWFDGAECNACSNAVDRHAAAGTGAARHSYSIAL